MTDRRELAERSLRASIKVREEAKVPLDDPASPFDLATALGISVRFVDINMEGMYAAGARPTILVSSLRPLARRAFTCGHELGHHAFGHGSTIDELKESTESGLFQPEEFLANTFAAFLTMPPPGLKKAFLRRGVRPADAKPIDIAAISSEFGVGYDTLITQLSAQRELREPTARSLRSAGLDQVRQAVLGASGGEALSVVDEHFRASTVDIEVGALIAFPSDVTIGNKLEHICRKQNRCVYVARNVGIERAHSDARRWGAFVRISPRRYVGLAAYRHLENDDE